MPFSLEILQEHRRHKRSSRKHLRNTRLLVIPGVRRKDYLVFDRGRLVYLNTIEKIGCIYCSYANGLPAMITEIAARTEQHFWPIKHARRLPQTHSRYGEFCPTEMPGAVGSNRTP